jgi:hypothetical protein
MKKNRILLEIAILVGTISPFIILYLLKGKTLFIEFDKYLQVTLMYIVFAYFYPLYIYQKNINSSLNIKSNYRFRIAWFFVSLSFGCLYLFGKVFSFTSDSYFKYHFILMGIWYMIGGNYHILVLKAGFNNFMNDENVLRKIQRNVGRFEFFIGLVLIIFCFFIPNSKVNLFDVFSTLNFIFLIGIAWIKKSTK